MGLVFTGIQSPFPLSLLSYKGRSVRLLTASSSVSGHVVIIPRCNFALFISGKAMPTNPAVPRNLARRLPLHRRD